MDRNTVLEWLRAGDSGTRLRAARELRAWSDGETQRALVGALADDAREVRQAAVQTLMEIGDGSAVPHLVPLLRAGEPPVRNGARQVLEALGRVEPRALADLSRDPDPRMRVFAANIMGGTGDHDHAGRLVEMLDDADPNAVEAAVSALGRLGAREAVPGLRRIAAQTDSWLRFSAIDALGSVIDPSAERALIDLVTASGDDFIEPVIDALGRQGGSASVTALVGLMEQRPAARDAAFRTLVGPLAARVASFGRDPRLAPLALAAAEALRRNQLPARLARTTAVLLAAIQERENS